MRRVLIVRTVSVEEMTPLAAACLARWPRARICVLTSPNRKAELLSLGCIDEVIDYTSAVGGFVEPWTDDRQFEAVVVPVRNASGWGYGNVWHAVSQLKSSSHWIAQWGTTLSRVSLRRMRFKALLEDAVQRACAWPARALGALLLAHVRQRETTS